MTLPCYIIHMERTTARHARAEALRQALGPGAQVVSAVDGAQLGPAALAAAVGPRQRPYYPFALCAAEIATFLSHRACWQRLLDDGHAMALIVEDDVEIGPDFARARDLALAHIPPGAVVRLPVKDRETGPSVAAQGDARLFRPRLVGLGMQAQVVTAGAAARLLAATERFDRPVDAFLQLAWLHGVDMLSVRPSGIGDMSSSIGGSTVQRKLSPAERLTHEVRRPLYRLSVRLWAWAQRSDA